MPIVSRLFAFSRTAIWLAFALMAGFGGSGAATSLAQAPTLSTEASPQADGPTTPNQAGGQPVRPNDGGSEHGGSGEERTDGGDVADKFEQEDAEQEDADKGDGADGDEQTLTAEQLESVRDWIDQLGSSEFAKRERAAVQLMELGKGVLPELRRVVEESADAEQRLRASQIIQEMTEGDLQVRISEFLAGKEVDFRGWNEAQNYLGDSMAVRELFVEMMLAHPEFVESLEGTPRDRAMAFEQLLTRVQAKLRTIGDEAGRADVFALLLVGNDPSVALNNLYETLLLTITRRHVVTSIRRDAQLSGQFHGLLNKWMYRSSLTNREDALLMGMSWDLPATLPMALQTLEETTQTETISICMQALSKFGDRRQTETLKRFLDDSRPVSDRGLGNAQSQPQVRDLAMLTLAMIYDLPFEEIGMEHVQTHPTSGFIPSDIAYVTDPETSREKALARIRRLLQDQSEADAAQQQQ